MKDFKSRLFILLMVASMAYGYKDPLPDDQRYLEKFIPRTIRSISDHLSEDTFKPRFIRSTSDPLSNDNEYLEIFSPRPERSITDPLEDTTDYLETFKPRYLRSISDTLPEDDDYLETLMPRCPRSFNKNPSYSSTVKNYQEKRFISDPLPEENDYLETFNPRHPRSISDTRPEDDDYLETLRPRFPRSFNKNPSYSSTMKNDPETWLRHSTLSKNKIGNLQTNSESQDKSQTAENHKSPAAEAYTSLMTPTCTSISHTIGLAKPAPTLSEITEPVGRAS